MISVVVPTCRRPDLLARCLDRLAPGAQTLPADRYEVIVTDDGVPTAQALVTARYPWARWVAGPRRGPAANRNSGAGQARGEWLAFTDDDCVPAPGWLAGFASAAGPGTDVYEGKTTCEAGLRSPLDHAPVNLSGGHLWSCNMMVRADLYARLGGFDENFPYPAMEDVDFRDRLAIAGVDTQFVPAAVVDHPPRRIPGPWRMARTQESGVYHWYKSGRREWITPGAVARLFRTRLATARSFPVSRHTVVFAMASAVELAALCWLLPLWEVRYRNARRPTLQPVGPASPGVKP